VSHEEGEVINCPSCHGSKIEKGGKLPCTACKGGGKIEYSRVGGALTAPAGSWFPTKRRGKSGWLICLFGPEKSEMQR
jgi:hypothetical protein